MTFILVPKLKDLGTYSRFTDSVKSGCFDVSRLAALGYTSEELGAYSLEEKTPLKRRFSPRSPFSIPMTTPELSVIIPCHNESTGIEAMIQSWHAALSEEVESFEFLVINDGSTDGTGRIVDKLRKEFSSVRVIHQLNTGYSGALRRALEAARGQYLLQLDGNGRYEPSDFFPLWHKRDAFQLILGYRTHRLDSFLRRILGKLLRHLVGLLFNVPLRDPNVPFRLIWRETAREFLRRLPSTHESLNLSLAILIKREMPDDVAEAPVPYRPRPWGRSHLGLRALLAQGLLYLYELFKLRLTLSPLRFQDPRRLPRKISDPSY